MRTPCIPRAVAGTAVCMLATASMADGLQSLAPITAHTDLQSGEIVAYVSCVSQNSIIKLQDLTGDGTRHGHGEAEQFFQPGIADSSLNSISSVQAILAVEYDHLLIADGSTAESGSGVYRLRDLSGDGTAHGSGEAAVYWDGELPIDGSPAIDRPKAITIGPDGAVYIADNNTLSAFDGAEAPEAVWRIDEHPANEVTSTGNVELHHELCAADHGFCLSTEAYRWTEDGKLYFTSVDVWSNTVSVWVIEADGTLFEYANEDDLLGIRLSSTGLAIHPATGRPVLAAADANGRPLIVELADHNGSGAIEHNDDLNILYHADAAGSDALQSPIEVMDLAFAPDGSLWMLDDGSDSIIRFADGNGDGTFNGPGEVQTVYDAAEAELNGAAAIELPRAIAFAIVPEAAQTGDLNHDGVVNGKDLAILLSAWGDCPAADPCPADLTGNGSVGGDDLSVLLRHWSD